MYSFDENTLSDLHKDARGFRPRSESFWNEWSTATNKGKQSIWDGLCAELDRTIADEKEAEATALVAFETEVEAFIYYGAGNRETALRWMIDGETFYTSQCVEGWVYNKGILFTAFGRNLVKELMEIVTFSEE